MLPEPDWRHASLVPLNGFVAGIKSIIAGYQTLTLFKIEDNP
jgi:hypothetical protein